MLRAVGHATLGDITVTGPPIQVDGGRGDVRRAPPTFGQHTDEVLAELGYSPQETAEFAAKGVAISHAATSRRG
jgi:crotonobetainyl-CoA:carnitine CoA-transferase CaiB-like acyl-CoA transferase